MSQKKYKKNDLPIKVLNENINFIFCILSEYKVKFFGKSQNIAKFPDCLKLATVTSVFKKRGTFQKGNYWRVNILFIISKRFEQKLVAKFEHPLMMPYPNFNVVSVKGMMQNIVSLRRETVKKNKAFGTSLADLSKDFGCLVMIYWQLNCIYMVLDCHP